MIIVLLLVPALILFFPVSYKADILKKEERLSLRVSVFWLFHLVHAHIGMEKSKEESRTEKDVRIAGISIPRILKKRREKKKKGDQAKKVREIRREASKKPTVPPGQKRPPAAETKPLPVEVVKARHPGPLTRLGARISAFIGKLKKWKKKADKGADLIAGWLSYMGTESFERAKNTLLHEGAAILRHILPEKPEGYVRFGTDDPAQTGMILGIASILYPVFPEKLTICPDFLEPVLETELKAGGHIFLIVLLVRVVRILISKDVRKLIRRIMNRKKPKAKTERSRKGRSSIWRKTKRTQHFRTT